VCVCVCVLCACVCLYVCAVQGAEREQEVAAGREEVRHSPGVRAEPLGLEWLGVRHDVDIHAHIIRTCYNIIAYAHITSAYRMHHAHLHIMHISIHVV
jgi:hypothetical protein